MKPAEWKDHACVDLAVVRVLRENFPRPLNDYAIFALLHPGRARSIVDEKKRSSSVTASLKRLAAQGLAEFRQGVGIQTRQRRETVPIDQLRGWLYVVPPGLVKKRK